MTYFTYEINEIYKSEYVLFVVVKNQIVINNNKHLGM